MESHYEYEMIHSVKNLVMYDLKLEKPKIISPSNYMLSYIKRGEIIDLTLEMIMIVNYADFGSKYLRPANADYVNIEDYNVLVVKRTMWIDSSKLNIKNALFNFVIEAGFKESVHSNTEYAVFVLGS